MHLKNIMYIYVLFYIASVHLSLVILLSLIFQLGLFSFCLKNTLLELELRRFVSSRPTLEEILKAILLLVWVCW